MTGLIMVNIILLYTMCMIFHFEKIMMQNTHLGTSK